MDKIHIDAGGAREDCIRMQLPHIYSVSKKDRPGMVELCYDLSTVQFRSETGVVCGVHLTVEANKELYRYLQGLKNKGIIGMLTTAGLVSLSQIFPENYDPRNLVLLFPKATIRGWVLIPEQKAEIIARDLNRILSNPHNWVLEDWANERPSSILHRLLKAKREEWDHESKPGNPIS